jgi:hypothetical protein
LKYSGHQTVSLNALNANVVRIVRVFEKERYRNRARSRRI